MNKKNEAIMVMMFIYNELWVKLSPDNAKQDTPTKPLSKLLGQIRKKINALPQDVYDELKSKIAEAKSKALAEVVKGKYIASKEDMLTSFWDSLNRNPYQEVWVTERTVMKAINSISEKASDENDLEYINNSRVLIKSFIKHLGMSTDNRLSRLKYTVEQNLIIEGKR